MLLAIWILGKIRLAKRLAGTVQAETRYADEDYFWRNGYYCNPEDSSSLVENRRAVGMTANMAGRWGSITKAILLVTLIFCIGLSIALMPLDFGTVTAKQTNHSIELRGGTYYKASIDFSEVSEVILLKECPKMSRVWGSGMKHMALGDYYFSGYGNGTAMIVREADYFLMVKNNKGKWTVFSVKDSGMMLQYYDLLQTTLQQKMSHNDCCIGQTARMHLTNRQNMV